MTQKSLLTCIGETIDAYHTSRQNEQVSQSTVIPNRQVSWLRAILPTPGNVIFTLLVIGSLLWAQNAGAISLSVPVVNSSLTIPYQGRLANASGVPFTGNQNMEFRLYNAPSGGTPLWTEFWTGGNAVNVSDGLFSVLLGSLQSGLPSVVQSNSQLWLGITVGTDGEMSPRVQLGSAAYSMQALTVPDGSVTNAKIADNTISRQKLAATILPRLIGEKSCFSCGDTSETNLDAGWHLVKGANGEPIEVAVNTSGKAIAVSMTARSITSVPVTRWCGIEIYQNNIFIRRVHIDGVFVALKDYGCSGSVIFSDLLPGSYTFRAGFFFGDKVDVLWNFERQISVIEY